MPTPLELVFNSTSLTEAIEGKEDDGIMSIGECKDGKYKLSSKCQFSNSLKLVQTLFKYDAFEEYTEDDLI